MSLNSTTQSEWKIYFKKLLKLVRKEIGTPNNLLTNKEIEFVLKQFLTKKK